MSVTYPRLLGGLAVLWTVRMVTFTPAPWQPRWVWAALAIGYMAAAALLVDGREVRAGGGLLATVCAAELILLVDVTNSPVALMLWCGIIVAATEGHPRERALLLRVCVSCVYGFTALAKINPAFLAGDQLVRIAATRPQMEWASELVASPAGVALAFGTVAVELWFAAGLWFRRTRGVTAAVGVVFHAVMVPVATTSPVTGVLFLMVLNFGLVAAYPAFWHPIGAQQADEAAIQHRSLEPA